MMQDINLHDFLTTALAKFHHSDIGTVCRAVLTEADGAMLDAAVRSLVVQAVQLFTAQARMEERHNVCEQLRKIVEESASDSEIKNSLSDTIECLQKP
jgi:hypothetical protein